MLGKGPHCHATEQVLELIADSREIVRHSEELLQLGTPNTFLGRTRQELTVEDAKRTEQARATLDEYAIGLRAFLKALRSRLT